MHLAGWGYMPCLCVYYDLFTTISTQATRVRFWQLVAAHSEKEKKHFIRIKIATQIRLGNRALFSHKVSGSAELLGIEKLWWKTDLSCKNKERKSGRDRKREKRNRASEREREREEREREWILLTERVWSQPQDTATNKTNANWIIYSWNWPALK